LQFSDLIWVAPLRCRADGLGEVGVVLLARALYGQPRVLLLDEGAANLDESAEEAIADLIEKMPITRIVVAHRPALIRRAKRVFLVKDRQITELPRRDPALVEPLRART
jgi:ABC-type bacteriocin/lantibiotic exporter with double-glycine peptidase domain